MDQLRFSNRLSPAFMCCCSTAITRPCSGHISSLHDTLPVTRQSPRSCLARLQVSPSMQRTVRCSATAAPTYSAHYPGGRDRLCRLPTPHHSQCLAADAAIIAADVATLGLSLSPSLMWVHSIDPRYYLAQLQLRNFSDRNVKSSCTTTCMQASTMFRLAASCWGALRPVRLTFVSRIHFFRGWHLYTAVYLL